MPPALRPPTRPGRQPCAVSLEGVHQLCRFQIPYAHDAIIAAGQRQLATGHERHRVYSAIMVCKAIDQAGARRVGDVPLHHRVVERARQGRAARRRYGNRLDRAAMAGKVAGGQLVIVCVGCPRNGTQREAWRAQHRHPPRASAFRGRRVCRLCSIEPTDMDCLSCGHARRAFSALPRLHAIIRQADGLASLTLLFHLLDPQAVVFARPVGINLA
jgi:hypothetical protein